ncbi:MAG TPA: YHS domain-containing protein [Chloroflexota bacterium]|nr:YHS domain-containing protein [Chloroflexota bacterium]
MLSDSASLGGQIDPVCGERVAEQGNPHSSEYAEEPYFFCSATCLQRFDAEPDLFTIEPGEASLADRDRGIRSVANPGPSLHAKIEQPHCH